MRTRRRAAICSTVDDGSVVHAQQPQLRGMASSFESHEMEQPTRVFSANTVVLFGRCKAVAAPLYPAAVCSTVR
jgi:hypothetical protein